MKYKQKRSIAVFIIIITLLFLFSKNANEENIVIKGVQAHFIEKITNKTNIKTSTGIVRPIVKENKINTGTIKTEKESKPSQKNIIINNTLRDKLISFVTHNRKTSANISLSGSLITYNYNLINVNKITKKDFERLIKKYVFDTNNNFDFTNQIKNYKYELKKNKLLIVKKGKDQILNDNYLQQLYKEFNSTKNIKLLSSFDLTKLYIKEHSLRNIFKVKKIVIDKEKLENTFLPFIKEQIVLISYRERKNYKYDGYIRKYNIAKVYNTLKDNLLILKPNQYFYFGDIYSKDDKNETKYKYGKAIIGGKVVDNIYGGGVCGASTGFFQGIITNGGLIYKVRNHSKWYSNLYTANINGKKVTMPGLDSTYFDNGPNLYVKNKSKYPIWLVNKINEKKVEQNYTISFKNNNLKQRKFTFIKKKKKCYSWKVGSKTVKSCYQVVK